MPAQVELYDNAYSKYDADVYRQVRVDTYGEDLGQTSWVTNQESNEIPQWLGLSSGSSVLEIGCGSGRYALRLAQRIGCHVTGLDINPHGIQNARLLARAAELEALVRFESRDVAKGLPFSDCEFNAVFSNDAMCHIPGRLNVFREFFRVLKPGGRMLFSDALLIGGLLSHQEIAARSSIGYYVFSPPGENERLLEAAGFYLEKVMDTTQAAAEISGRWRKAREQRKTKLVAIESENDFHGLQRFLEGVHLLTSERRLLRFVYLAGKQG